MGIKQIVEPMFDKTGYQKSSLQFILNKFHECLADALKKDGHVQLNGIGTFSVQKRKARTGRNPKDGTALQIPEKTVVHFKMHKSLRDAFQEK